MLSGKTREMRQRLSTFCKQMVDRRTLPFYLCLNFRTQFLSLGDQCTKHVIVNWNAAAPNGWTVSPALSVMWQGTCLTPNATLHYIPWCHCMALGRQKMGVFSAHFYALQISVHVYQFQCTSPARENMHKLM